MTNFLRKSKKSFMPLNKKELEFLQEFAPKTSSLPSKIMSEEDYKKMLEMIQRKNSKFMNR
tara:strand:- start:1293 stop:1475 length:183 start_codon:yes stop_codon:yes gene_type:complete